MKENEIIFETTDSFLILIISIISCFSRLWTIAHPSVVVFDEVHFGNFSKWYVLNQFHFDIHPPLGKMLMAFIAKFAGYKGDIESFPQLGTAYKINETSYIYQRMTPAIFSAFVSPLIYLSLRCLYISPYSSFVAGIIISLDSSMIVEAKFILSDGMLHFFSALHFFSFCLFLRIQNDFLAIFSGITLGAATSCKFTALGLVAIDGITQLFWIFFNKPNLYEIIKRGILILFPTFFTIYLVWIIHFMITPFIGHHSYYIKKEDQHTLIDPLKINLTYWGNRVSKSPLLNRIIDWNLVMNRINMRSNIPHPWQSSPQYWPFLLDKYVSFYTGPGERKIPCMGSPAAYWLSSISILLIPIALIFKKADWKNLLLCFSWSVSYFPFLMVPRTMFHYHYLVPLMFAVMNLSILIDNLTKNSFLLRGSLLTLILLLNIFSYLFFWPLIYGTKCNNCWKTRIWLNRWIEGPPKVLEFFGNKLFNTSKKFSTLPY